MNTDKTLKKYEICRRESYSENTAEYGFGDFPKITWVCVWWVHAETVRKAQNLAKKARPDLGLSFSGQFGDVCWEREG
tara:strand:+ start:539 stop:772 length:234 start_codon:yes stop_codon:yes gene_type:complete